MPCPSLILLKGDTMAEIWVDENIMTPLMYARAFQINPAAGSNAHLYLLAPSDECNHGKEAWCNHCSVVRHREANHFLFKKKVGAKRPAQISLF